MVRDTVGVSFLRVTYSQTFLYFTLIAEGLSAVGKCFKTKHEANSHIGTADCTRPGAYVEHNNI